MGFIPADIKGPDCGLVSHDSVHESLKMSDAIKGAMRHDRVVAFDE
jgi:hypothetical protein